MSHSRALVRSLGLGFVVMFVIANIIGSGVYKKVAPMAAELHSASWVLLAWLVAGVVTMLGALSNAEVAGLLADTGGEYAYLRKIYNRFFAFMYGWSLLAVIQTATISSLAYIFAQSLHSIVPLPPMLTHWQEVSLGGLFFPFSDFSIKAVAIVLILLLTGLNILGLRGGAMLSRVILVMVVIGLALMVAFGWRSAPPSSGATWGIGDLASHPVTFSAFFTAMLAAFWAYQGWVSVGFIGGEVKDARRTLPKGIVVGVLAVIVVYLLVNAAYLRVLTVPQLEQVHASGNRIAAIEVMRFLGGEAGVWFISVLILLTTLGCTHASVLTGARPYYAMAGDRLFFPAIGRLNRAQVPGNALLWQGLWASVLVVSGTFDQLTDMIVFAVFIFYGATTLGVFILRHRMPQAHRPYRVWGYPVVPALFVLFCGVLFVNTIVARPREAFMGLTLMLSGVPVYFWMRRRRWASKDERRL
ncbi:APA family basic amino acid/polyamine antiporter [Breznakibacter xylanolyticus]|uniref:APA family basic amino acid/polyamine antiporter n=1 Tax=Breznakibacter xylanolyticus TaxID=990 RepID=A0A2W7N500_9BACT|nr:amino acid permease [Breznakibacter xylanolyticus]PZX15128.1 APA family basic amino acid/polyamine antiporter [Breznakibacter xylanolyticus]